MASYLKIQKGSGKQNAFTATRGEHAADVATCSIWTKKAVLYLSVPGDLYEEQNVLSSCSVLGDEFKVP